MKANRRIKGGYTLREEILMDKKFVRFDGFDTIYQIQFPPKLHIFAVHEINFLLKLIIFNSLSIIKNLFANFY